MDSAATTPTQSVQPVVPEPPHDEAELERSGTSATLPDQEEGDRRRNSMGQTAPFEGERKCSAAGDDFRDPIETVWEMKKMKITCKGPFQVVLLNKN